MKFLESYSNEVLGPVQKDEAVFLYGLALAIRPRVVLELGSYFGHSTRCFVEAGVELVIAVDCRVTQELLALQKEAKADQLAVLEANIGLLTASRLRELYGIDDVDLIFFDASHDFDLNKKVFTNLRPLLSNNGMVVVHDTGCWLAEHMGPEHHNFHGGQWVGGRFFFHQPGEVEFAEWLETTAGMSRIDIYSKNTLRHGISLFQV